MGAMATGLKTGTAVTAKVIAKIVLGYAILVPLLHSPSILGGAGKAAARNTANEAKAAAEVRSDLAEVGITVSEAEPRRSRWK
jgi:hypothetical protein